MPVYTYNALNTRGKTAKGVINADSARAARTKLRQSGLFPTELLETKEEETQKQAGTYRDLQLFRRVRPQDLTIMTRQFATLLAANLTVVDSFTALIEQTENPSLKKTLIQVRESVNEGSTLATALGQHRRMFSNLFVNMVSAGEASGALSVVLLRLADFSERQLDTRKRITSKMYYPLFMIIIGFLVLLALLTYVVPTVTSIFDNMDQTLPWITVVLISISDLFRDFWWLIISGVIAATLMLQRYRRTERGTIVFDKWQIRAPVIGKLVLKMAMSRFTRTLGILLHSGIPLLDALEISGAVVNNTVLNAAIATAKDDIREGSDIASPLKASGYFPPLVSHMISIGEKSGQLEDMLLRVADVYDNEVQISIEGLTALLEPVIIVAMAGVVFVIMLAVLLPIFELNTIVR
ncbi:MAG: type II secretion system inner membrane protein GspF [Candidatus Tectomicrobia bacterium]